MKNTMDRYRTNQEDGYCEKIYHKNYRYFSKLIFWGFRVYNNRAV